MEDVEGEIARFLSDKKIKVHKDAVLFMWAMVPLIEMASNRGQVGIRIQDHDRMGQAGCLRPWIVVADPDRVITGGHEGIMLSETG